MHGISIVTFDSYNEPSRCNTMRILVCGRRQRGYSSHSIRVLKAKCSSNAVVEEKEN